MEKKPGLWISAMDLGLLIQANIHNEFRNKTAWPYIILGFIKLKAVLYSYFSYLKNLTSKKKSNRKKVNSG
jgi:hypothetical protein